MFLREPSFPWLHLSKVVFLTTLLREKMLTERDGYFWQFCHDDFCIKILFISYFIYPHFSILGKTLESQWPLTLLFSSYLLPGSARMKWKLLRILNMIKVNNYEIVMNFFYIRHNLTWYSAIVHKFTRITQFVQLMNWQNNSCKFV